MVKTYDKKKDLNLRLSQNFKLSEFDCKCSRAECTTVLLDDKLVEILQKIRDHFGKSVNVNSGHRCSKHNKAIGGSTSSHHMKGQAADIWIKDVKPVEIAQYAESIGVKRIGLYDMAHGYFVHIGSAPTKKFWKNTSSNTVKTFIEEVPQTFVVEMTVLKRGMKSNEVKALQTLLNGYGHALDTDGSFGGKTESAVKEYQKSIGLEQTGIVDEVTRKSLMGL